MRAALLILLFPTLALASTETEDYCRLITNQTEATASVIGGFTAYANTGVTTGAGADGSGTGSSTGSSSTIDTGNFMGEMKAVASEISLRTLISVTKVAQRGGEWKRLAEYVLTAAN